MTTFSPWLSNELRRHAPRYRPSRPAAGVRAALQIAELLAEQTVTRAPDAANPAPDPGRRQAIGIVVELVIEQPTPQHLPSLLTHPAAYPACSFDIVQRFPVVALGRQESVQPIAELGDKAQTAKLEQAPPGYPRAASAPGTNSPSSSRPSASCRQVPIRPAPQKSMVRDAMEMVITLDLQAAEVERSGHPAYPVICFEKHRLMPVQRQLVSHGQAHRPRAQYGNPLPHLRTPVRRRYSADR